MELFDLFQRPFEWLDVTLEPAGAASGPGVGQGRAFCHDFQGIARGWGADADCTTATDSQNDIARKSAKSPALAPSRLQRDPTAGAANFAACTAVTSGERDIPTPAGVLGTATSIARPEPDSTTRPSVYVVHGTVPAPAALNLKSRRGVVTVGSSVRTIHLDGGVKNYGLEHSRTVRAPLSSLAAIGSSRDRKIENST